MWERPHNARYASWGSPRCGGDGGGSWISIHVCLSYRGGGNAEWLGGGTPFSASSEPQVYGNLSGIVAPGGAISSDGLRPSLGCCAQLAAVAPITRGDDHS